MSLTHHTSEPGNTFRRASRHPLEIVVPWFRRFPRSLPRNLLYTFIFNEAWAVAFMLLAPAYGAGWKNVVEVAHAFVQFSVISNCIGFVIQAELALIRRFCGEWLERQSDFVRTLYFIVTPAIGLFVGYWLGFTLLHLQRTREQALQTTEGVISILLLGLVISAVLAAIFYARERQARAEALFHRQRAVSEATERQARVAELQLLEAQVEPHFLYNTLANVIGLVDANPAAAKRMLERLVDYWREAARSSTGEGGVTLAQQVALLRAYLDLIALRMGSRLVYRIDVPAALGNLRLPPMLLQPLVENAIKHGLEPKVEGGTVQISAERRAGSLWMCVCDDGLGVASMRLPGSTGLGIANLRERLESLFGHDAQLLIRDHLPTGTCAEVRIQFDRLEDASHER